MKVIRIEDDAILTSEIAAIVLGYPASESLTKHDVCVILKNGRQLAWNCKTEVAAEAVLKKAVADWLAIEDKL